MPKKKQDDQQKEERKQKTKQRGNGEGSIYQRNDGTWCATLTIGRDSNGKLKRKYIYGKTRAEVKDKMNSDLNSIAQGTFVEQNNITVGTWIDTWLYEYKKQAVRPTTFQSYEYLSRIHIKPVLGSILLKDLRPDNIQKFYNEKLKSGKAGRKKLNTGESDNKKEGLNPKTIKNIHSVLHEALDQALKNNLIIRNPSDAVNTPRRVKKDIRVLTIEEQNNFIEALEGERYKCIFLIALGAGMRQGEILALQLPDIDLKKGTIKVNRSIKRVKVFDENKKSHTEIMIQEPKTKSGKREIPIPQYTVKAIKEYIRNKNIENPRDVIDIKSDGFMFEVSPGKPVEAVGLIKDMKRIFKKAQIENVTFHALRHTYATRLLEKNVHPKVVQELLGHSEISMTLNTYSHVMPEIKIAAAAKLDEVFNDNKKSSQKEG